MLRVGVHERSNGRNQDEAALCLILLAELHENPETGVALDSDTTTRAVGFRRRNSEVARMQVIEKSPATGATSGCDMEMMNDLQLVHIVFAHRASRYPIS